MHPSSPEARRIRARLEARRRELVIRYKDMLDLAEAELARESGELVDVANDQRDAGVLALVSEHDALALEHTVAALHRLDGGQYGRCTSCGETIDAARLRALPDVAHCTACATHRERRRKRPTFATSQM